MKSIQNKIDRLMDQHSIKKYVDLLRMIGKQLDEKDVYAFADKEKSNFTKMLKGERPLKHEFIIPLEKIFGVPMAKMLYEDEYNTDFSKEDLPFIKGFRYYAYKDDPELYNGEFERNLVDVEGSPYICNTDEYGKWFLDYVIEYKAVNGVRYLVDKHGLKVPPLVDSRYYDIEDANGYKGMMCRTHYGLDYLVVEEDMDDVFKKIYDPYYCYVHIRHDGHDSVLKDERFLGSILRSEKIFNSLFKINEVDFIYANRNIIPKPEHELKKIKVINPILNLCLNYALERLDEYRKQAIRILEFGLEYNPKAINDTGEALIDLNTREFGNVCYKNGYEMLTSIVYPAINIEDREISALIDKLPAPRYIGF